MDTGPPWYLVVSIAVLLWSPTLLLALPSVLFPTMLLHSFYCTTNILACLTCCFKCTLQPILLGLRQCCNGGGCCNWEYKLTFQCLFIFYQSIDLCHCLGNPLSLLLVCFVWFGCKMRINLAGQYCILTPLAYNDAIL